jgi:hypothetical protein
VCGGEEMWLSVMVGGESKGRSEVSRAAKRAQSRIGWIGVSQPRAWRSVGCGCGRVDGGTYSTRLVTRVLVLTREGLGRFELGFFVVEIIIVVLARSS